MLQCGSVSSAGKKKVPRIGMAVIFTLDEFDDSRREFETFFFSHITLIEGQLVALRTAIEKCAGEPTKVTESIMEVSLTSVVKSAAITTAFYDKLISSLSFL